MPLMGGFEFLEAKKQHSKLNDIPVFVLTTSNYGFDQRRSERCGAMAFFSKAEVAEDEKQFIHEVALCCSMF